jgi:hypothetical protein
MNDAKGDDAPGTKARLYVPLSAFQAPTGIYKPHHMRRVDVRI